jgi:hypothetical protein
LRIPVPIEDDDEVRDALAWFHSLGGPGLAQRITAAQDHFMQMTTMPAGKVDWTGLPDWLLPTDPVASILAQGHALIEDRRMYDFRLGGTVVPFIKAVGHLLPFVERVEGARGRARRLLAPTQDHPIGALFELIAAGRYAAADLGPVAFIPEASTPTPDFSVDLGELKAFVECKCLRPSEFDRTEDLAAAALFSETTGYIHDRHLSVHIDVSFKVPVTKVPSGYLLAHLRAATGPGDGQAITFRWNDGYGEGAICSADVAAAQADSTTEGALMLGPKMVRLLTGGPSPERGYCLSVGGATHDEDSRYIDAIDYASVLTWQSSSEEAAAANAQHVKSTLAKIDRQLRNFGPGIAHIAVDVPNSVRAAELKKERNDAEILAFRWTAPLVEIHTHYLQPRASELASWVMDESATYRGATPTTLLADPRMFGGDDIGDEPGWQIPLKAPGG